MHQDDPQERGPAGPPPGPGDHPRHDGGRPRFGDDAHAEEPGPPPPPPPDQRRRSTPPPAAPPPGGWAPAPATGTTRAPTPTVPPPGAAFDPSGPQQPPKPRPSLADAVVLPLWILGGQLLAGLALLPGMILTEDPDDTMSTFIAVSAVLGWLAVVMGTALWLRYRGAWHRHWLTGHRPRSAWLPALIGVGGAVGGMIVVSIVISIIAVLTGTEPPEQEIFELLDDPVIGWVLGALAVLVAPVVEEVVFRGVVLDVMARSWNWWVAAVAQAAVFSAIHIETLTSPSMFLALGLLGFLFAVLRRVTGSLVAPIVAHLVFNAISLGAALLV